MDLLTDTLNLARIKARVLDQRELPAQFSLRFPCSRSIGFHVVLKGRVYIHTPGNKTPIVLERGDIALMARGCDHHVATEERRSAQTRTARVNEKTSERVNAGGNAVATVVSGAYQLWNDPVHPFFLELPDWFVLKNSELSLDDGLYLLMELLSKETSERGLGNERAIQGILDVMFSLIMRRVMKASKGEKAKWTSSIQDDQIKRAMELLHQKINHPWSLDEIAKSVGVSRSGLASKFKKTTGDSPLRYLSTLRIQKAIDLLTSSDHTVEQIAYEVGFNDSFTFSKSFKKLAGVAPRDYRRINAPDSNRFS